MDAATRRKWDHAARTFDLMSGFGPERRWEPAKRKLFENMREDAEILFVALGTGLDIACFPPHRKITAIDISPRMLERARPRIESYDGRVEAIVEDVHELRFADNSFDQIFTSCTFCSVPNPIDGLKSLRRVLKPGGDLYMFEHTGSRWFPFNLLMHAMTPISSLVGPDMNRRTVANVRAAGFELHSVNNVFLDVVKTIHATKPTGR
jgi:ubiquinone/menaquinone biosynthesis C-methylase UbiE